MNPKAIAAITAALLAVGGAAWWGLRSLHSVELSVARARCAVMCFGSGLGSAETAKMPAAKLRAPVVSCSTPEHALVPASVVDAKLGVGLILGMRRDAKIRSSVVEAVSVDVINLESRRSENRTMQCCAWLARDRIPCTPVVMSTPTTTGYCRNILDVNERSLPLRKMDFENAIASERDLVSSLDDNAIWHREKARLGMGHVASCGRPEGRLGKGAQVASLSGSRPYPRGASYSESRPA